MSPDVTPMLPDPAIENASAAHTVMRANNMAPSAALEAVTAAPQPLLPASRRSVESAAANQSRFRKPMQKMTVAMRIRVRSPS